MVLLVCGDDGSCPSPSGFNLDVSQVPLGSKGVHDLHVEWLVATMKRGEETQPVPEKPTKT